MSYADLQKNREYTNEYRKTHPRNYKLEYNAAYKKAHLMTTEQNHAYRLHIKKEVFAAYGGETCVCCGENHIEFLSIHHTDGNGAEHRKLVPAPYLYGWLKKNGFPTGFEILCMNCNFAMGHFGKCPHQESEYGREERYLSAAQSKQRE